MSACRKCGAAMKKCSACEGTGKKGSSKCTWCKGTGEICPMEGHHKQD